VEARFGKRELREGCAPFNDGQRTVVAVVLVNTWGRGRWIDAARTARGVVVAGIKMPWRHDGDRGGVCVGGDQPLRWKGGRAAMLPKCRHGPKKNGDKRSEGKDHYPEGKRENLGVSIIQNWDWIRKDLSEDMPVICLLNSRFHWFGRDSQKDHKSLIGGKLLISWLCENLDCSYSFKLVWLIRSGSW
jgi:hypothetical protein